MINSIPPEIRDFLTDCIESVSQLELLLFIYERKNIQWSAEEISRELRTHTTMASKQMEQLASKGVLEKLSENKFQYAPIKEDTHKKVNELFSLYHERPVAIVTFIFTKPEDKLKGFADAFKFKKD